MDFIFIANAWSAGVDNPTGKHQLAVSLADLGHRVLWIEGAGMRRPTAARQSDRGRIRAKLARALRGVRPARAGIWHTAPLIIPIPSSGIIRAINGIIYALAAGVGSLRLGLRRPVLVNFLPVVPVTERLWPWTAIYFCVDRWDRFEMYDSDTMTRCDSACCRHADLVLTTSADLQVRCAPKNPRTMHIGHGVNRDHFAAPLARPLPRPADLPDGRIVGFFGLLSEWVDQSLIVRLARTLATTEPSACIVLIGPADVALDALRAEPNIRILGGKPFSALPAYTAHFDVAIIPFVINDLTIAVNPIKLREMLAAGCPVIATALPEVAAIAITNKYAVAANTPDAFIGAVLDRLSKPLSLAERQRISDTVSNESWQAKAERLLCFLAEGEEACNGTG